jgi:MFS superfamily sulfate permease-like transporter
MRRILRVRRDEFVVAALTAAVVVVVGVEQAILLAIVVSLIDHLRHSYKPRNTVLVRTPDGRLASQPVAAGGEAAPGLVVYRFAAGLYYANANRLAEEVRRIATEGVAPRWLCLDADGIDDIDYTGAETLRELHQELQASNVRLVIALQAGAVRRELDRMGITDVVGSDAYFETVEAVLDAFDRA